MSLPKTNYGEELEVSKSPGGFVILPVLFIIIPANNNKLIIIPLD